MDFRPRRGSYKAAEKIGRWLKAGNLYGVPSELLEDIDLVLQGFGTAIDEVGRLERVVERLRERSRLI